MDDLNQKFEKTRAYLLQLVDKLDHRQFLQEEECEHANDLFQSLAEGQQECIRSLQSSGLEVGDCTELTSLEALEAAWVRQEQQRGKIHSIVDRFLAIQSTEEHQAELDRFRSRLLACSEEELIHLSRSGELDLYERFADWVDGTQSDDEENASVRKYFGYQMAYAVYSGQLVLPPKKTSVTPAAETTHDVPAQPAADPALKVPLGNTEACHPSEDMPVAAEPAEGLDSSESSPPATVPVNSNEGKNPVETAQEGLSLEEFPPTVVPADESGSGESSHSATVPVNPNEGENPVETAQEGLLITTSVPSSNVGGTASKVVVSSAEEPKQEMGTQKEKDFSTPADKGTEELSAESGRNNLAEVLKSTCRIEPHEASAKSFQKEIASMPHISRAILVVLTHLGVASPDLIGCYMNLFSMLQENPDPEQIQIHLQDLVRKSFIAEYEVPGLEQSNHLYCLTAYSYRSLQKDTIRKFLQQYFGWHVGQHELIGKEEILGDPLMRSYYHNCLVVFFMISQAARDSDFALEEIREIRFSLKWQKDHYVALLKLDGEMKSWQMYDFWREHPGPGNGPVLFLGPLCPAGPFPEGDPVFCLIDDNLYHWEQGAWIGTDGIPYSGELFTRPGQESIISSAVDHTTEPSLEEETSLKSDSGIEPNPETKKNAAGGSEAESESALENTINAEVKSELDAGTEAEPAPEQTVPLEESVGQSKATEPSEEAEQIVAQNEVSPAEEAAGHQDQETSPGTQKSAEIPEHVDPQDGKEPEAAKRFATPQTAQEYAQELLQNEDIKHEDLLYLTVLLISEGRMAEAASLAEVLANEPGAGDRYDYFYQVFRQAAHIPGAGYQYNSITLNEQQKNLAEENPELRELEQTMLLSSLIWSLAFPTTAYDRNLYNQARAALNPDSSPDLTKLLNLLSVDLKDVTFQQDGLGFSYSVLSKLAGDGEREQQRRALQQQAEELLNTPTTSSIHITGLETCLKYMTGPASPLGELLRQVSAGDCSSAAQIKQKLQNLLGDGNQNREEQLEQFIDKSWLDVRNQNEKIRLRQISPDTPARRCCRKAVTDRVEVVRRWLDVVGVVQDDAFAQRRDQYARILSQVRDCLRRLQDSLPAGDTPYQKAGYVILRDTAGRMLQTLDGQKPKQDLDFFLDLCRTPNLILDENGHNVIIPELYDLPGMEPWVPLLRAVAGGLEDPEQILKEIENYENPKWYRNYGVQQLLQQYLGKNQVLTADWKQAEKNAQEEEESFKSETRLNRAYGRIQESDMETAFKAIDAIRDVYFDVHNYAGFLQFLNELEAWLDKKTERSAVEYDRRVSVLEADAHFAGAPILEAIRSALGSRNFLSVDSLINQLQSGVLEIPDTEKILNEQEDYLRQFQECEDGYYDVCNIRQHRSASLPIWGERALSSMDERYKHWSSGQERRTGCLWLKNWPTKNDSVSTPYGIQSLLTGLGFKVTSVDLSTRQKKQGNSYEVFKVSAEPTPRNRTDYPHPVYPFGTELTDPMTVVCLYGCQGESTLINMMTQQLTLNGSTLVLMDGSLSPQGRHTVAARFKADTSGQKPFLLIDRVLLLYLASLDAGQRPKALLQCTLPYTYEQLYGNGTGSVQEEMFIGRVREMDELCSDQGPSLVYGGRQLGKTALLNRASQILHNPDNKDYSFCVDIKDHGSRYFLDQLNRKLKNPKMPKIVDQPFESLEDLCEALKYAYEDGTIHRLRIFVDEADCLFEEFQQEDYRPLRPFITLRDDTKHYVKFVFAGTHNVAATDRVEEENNNLLHMGSALCIEPLSPRDAMLLIRIPMSFLGFEIGDPQIELILSSTNSYPGLIHMFCHALIESVCRDYARYYSASSAGSRENPPYRITDEQMRAVFKEKDIRKEIGVRVMATIKLNQKYKVVSLLLAQKIYEDQEQECSSLYGYSARELINYNAEQLELPLIAELGERNLDALLDEMVRMGILWRNDDTRSYRFRQQDFLSYIGSSEQVLEALLKEYEEEAG